MRSAITSAARGELLDATALDAAHVWTTQLFAELSHEGRVVEGGWPGTVNEARGRCSDLASRALAARAMPVLAREELVRLTQIAYAEARRLWRANDRWRK